MTLITLENTLVCILSPSSTFCLGQPTRAHGPHPSRTTPPFGDGEFGAPKRSERLPVLIIAPLAELFGRAGHQKDQVRILGAAAPGNVP